MARTEETPFMVAGQSKFSLANPDPEIDPVVAARLVHLANSVAFATFTKLESVLACVTRLGVRELSFFLMETAARQLVECHDPRIALICDGLWEHSLSVAILSHDLVEALPGLDAEAAYLAGLLHDIGRPVVAEMLLDAEGRLLGKRVDHWIMPSKWLGIITQCERTVGLAVTKAWTLPDSVIDAVGPGECTGRGGRTRLDCPACRGDRCHRRRRRRAARIGNGYHCRCRRGPAGAPGRTYGVRRFYAIAVRRSMAISSMSFRSDCASARTSSARRASSALRRASVLVCAPR